MTGLIAIDESGDLGPSGTEYFTIAALVMFRPRSLKKAANTIPKRDYEVKWNNSCDQTRRMVFEAMSELPFTVVHSTVNKNHPLNHRPIYGNELYETMLRQVIIDSFEVLPCKDVNVYLDSCPFINLEKFRGIVFEESKACNVNPKKVNKISSQESKCIQLVDFIAGAARSESEYSDETLKIIQDKISIARRR